MRIIPKQLNPEERIKHFEEVNLGYTEDEAVAEASRCKLCGACVKGCPVHIDIPAFIKEITEKKFKESIHVIKLYSVLPSICGRVCPQENQCEKFCILKKKGEAINIGGLERFVADNYDDFEPIIIKESNKSAAIVGSGPAGLTAAYELRKAGFRVVVYEALHASGGVLRYGIPSFRLPDYVIDREVDYLTKLGVEFKYNFLIGKTVFMNELLEQFDALLIATGAGLPSGLKIPGENSVGVYLANEYLTRMNLMQAYKFPDYQTPIKKLQRVIVLGGGNVAMDAARVAKRQGAEVLIAYRREEKDMPARFEERERAKEEGIVFRTMIMPVAILHDDKKQVNGVRFEIMRFFGTDDKGKSKIKGTNLFEIIEADMVIIAIGQNPNKIIQENVNGLSFDDKGRIIVDENMKTTKNRVWAAGDIVSGAATVILAMGDAKKASDSIVKEFI